MFADLSLTTGLFLSIALALALTFEFVNGFHDTANAVATVIYTNTLKPNVAVVWSGIWNLAGVLASGGAVAFSVLALLPVELVLNVGSAAGFAMVFSLLVSAILWNLGTWYLGLPASSSHTLIGSVMGVGLANAFLTGGTDFGAGVNWTSAGEVATSLLVSPVVGFAAAGLLLLGMKAVAKAPSLYREPPPGVPPPNDIRALLILTCTGVSFAHGSNDGQKGIGLILLILVGILPAQFAVNPMLDAATIAHLAGSARTAQVAFENPSHRLTQDDAVKELSAFLKTDGRATTDTEPALFTAIGQIGLTLEGTQSIRTLTDTQKTTLRSDVYIASASIAKLTKAGTLTGDLARTAQQFSSDMELVTRYIPLWVKVAIALALGLGTMVGWQRIVKTVGEKIGKTHLSYAQGAVAEVVAAATIGAADFMGMPVSTTHVLSSGVAGTMAANRSGLQTATLRNLLLAWVLTMPVCVFLGALLFALSLNLVAGMGWK